MAVITNRKNGAYYTDIPDDDAQAIVDEWNDGLGRSDWGVESYSYDNASPARQGNW